MSASLDAPVANISDTARWVAADRAQEGRRPDPLFVDPYAGSFAGDRGRAIAAAASPLTRNGWWLITRTKLIDDLVDHAVRRGCDRIVNLAAGYDTRPFRLDLPPSLLWIEVDLPDLIAEKNRCLNDDRARCQVRRIACDLGSERQRQAALDESLEGAAAATVITEGLVVYLLDEDVESLARDLRRPNVAGWIVDVHNQPMLRILQRSTNELLGANRFVFGPPDWAAFFGDTGWHPDAVIPLIPAAGRFGRLPRVVQPFAKILDVDPARHPRWPTSVVTTLRPGSSHR